MMSRLSRLALDAFTIISSFFFLSAVTDGRKGSQDKKTARDIVFHRSVGDIVEERRR